MKRKLLISLGAITALTPVIAVVACGKITEPTPDQLDLYRKLTSSEVQRLFEEKWDEKVIAEKVPGILPVKNASNVVTEGTKQIVDENGVYKATGLFKLTVDNNPELKEVVYYILRNEIAKDGQYLFKIATQFLGDRVKMWKDAQGADDNHKNNNWDLSDGKQVTREYLVANGLSQFYNYGNLPKDALTNDAMNMLLNYSKSDFRVKVYRQLVAESYLNVSKTDYSKAFLRNSRNFTTIQQAIKEDEFVVTNETLSQKLFAQWNIKLEKNESLGYLFKSTKALADVRASFTKGGDLATSAAKSLSNTVEHEVTVAGTDFILPNATYSPLIGWKGFSTQAAVDKSKTLSFALDDLKKITTKAQWEGVVQNNELVVDGKDIKYIDTDNQKDSVDMTYQVGILPIFVDNKFTLLGDATHANFSADQLKQIKRLLAYKNDTLYKTASEYYRTEIKDDKGTVTKKAIILDITQKDIKKILEDANFEFIKPRTAE